MNIWLFSKNTRLLLYTALSLVISSLLYANDSALINDSSIIFDTDEGNGQVSAHQKVDKKTPENKKRERKTALAELCDVVDAKYKVYNWGDSLCQKINFLQVRKSYLGHPLIWYKSASETEKKKRPVTLITCGIQGDQENSVKFCFDLIANLAGHKFPDRFFVVAPIVNPDAFFRKKPKRTNQRTVDISRNFPYGEQSEIISHWKNEKNNDLRFNPGKGPRSELETIFLTNLIRRYSPQKVIIIQDNFETSEKYTRQDKLSKTIRNSTGLKTFKGPFIPGSLAEWTKESGIKTYTSILEYDDPSEYSKNTKALSSFIDLL